MKSSKNHFVDLRLKINKKTMNTIVNNPMKNKSSTLLIHLHPKHSKHKNKIFAQIISSINKIPVQQSLRFQKEL
jgi:hypothetical protein